jgi:hypothetical protein
MLKNLKKIQWKSKIDWSKRPSAVQYQHNKKLLFDKHKQCWICGNKSNKKYCSNKCLLLSNYPEIQKLLTQKLPVKDSDNFKGISFYANS